MRVRMRIGLFVMVAVGLSLTGCKSINHYVYYDNKIDVLSERAMNYSERVLEGDPYVTPRQTVIAVTRKVDQTVETVKLEAGEKAAEIQLGTRETVDAVKRRIPKGTGSAGAPRQGYPIWSGPQRGPAERHIGGRPSRPAATPSDKPDPTQPGS